MRTFTHLWQQDDLSDCDIVLTAQQQSSGTEEGTCKLVSFPGHVVLLSDSPYFKAQILRWQNKRQREDDDPAQQAEQAAADSTQPDSSSRQRNSTSQDPQQDQEQQQQGTGSAEAGTTSSPADSSTSRRPQLVLTLDHADHQQAALAVLQSLYFVPTESGMLSQITQEEQLQAAILADMWQVPDVGTAAASLLAAVADGQLASEVEAKLMAMQAVPGCLEPLLKKVLLHLLGDLEAVWADDALQELLLGLPLHAMKLLLSCDELKVATEDTVLYTVRRYIKGAWAADDSLELLQVIRCPHLSMFWLAGLAMPKDPEFEMLSTLLPDLSTLLTARIIKADFQVGAEDLQKRFPGAPRSWALPERVIRPVSSVQMTWELPIEQLRQAAWLSIANDAIVPLFSTQNTPPLGGVHFKTQIQCKPKVGSCSVGVFATPQYLPADLCMPYKFRLEVPGTMSKHWCQASGLFNVSRGYADFFGLGAMAGGWDELAWAAKGLPTGGTVAIKLAIKDSR